MDSPSGGVEVQGAIKRTAAELRDKSEGAVASSQRGTTSTGNFIQRIGPTFFRYVYEGGRSIGSSVIKGTFSCRRCDIGVVCMYGTADAVGTGARLDSSVFPVCTVDPLQALYELMTSVLDFQIVLTFCES